MVSLIYYLRFVHKTAPGFNVRKFDILLEIHRDSQIKKRTVDAKYIVELWRSWWYKKANLSLKFHFCLQKYSRILCWGLDRGVRWKAVADKIYWDYPLKVQGRYIPVHFTPYDMFRILYPSVYTSPYISSLKWEDHIQGWVRLNGNQFMGWWSSVDCDWPYTGLG